MPWRCFASSECRYVVTKVLTATALRAGPSCRTIPRILHSSAHKGDARRSWTNPRKGRIAIGLFVALVTVVAVALVVGRRTAHHVARVPAGVHHVTGTHRRQGRHN